MKLLKAFLIGSALIAPATANAAVVGAQGQLNAPFATLTGAGTPNSGGTLNGGTLGTITGGTVYTSDLPFADIPEGVFGGTFLAVGTTAGQPATLTFAQPTTAFGFLIGSPDSFNQLIVTSTLGAFTFTPGSLGLATDGNQSLSQYVNFATSVAGETILSVAFNNVPANNAFETANFSVAAVPEPATWGMMILGFGVIGGAMRRRSVNTSVRFA